MTEKTVSVSRRIGASPDAIFRVLTDPGRHTGIDGSGMLRGAITTDAVTQVGDVFAMKMHHAEMGDYEMNNTVVQFEPGHTIVWEPSRRDVETDSWHYRWGYVLEPDGDDATRVTEFFDLSHSPEEAHVATKDGEVWREAMSATLERLDGAVAG